MNFELMNNNKVTVSGEVATQPVFSHDVLGEGFYEFDLKVKRLSDQFDIVPITISERLVKDSQIVKGKQIALSGQFRSYNKQIDEKSKLMLTVFVREVLQDLDAVGDVNEIILSGFVCKAPIYRTTPFNREICDVLIAVNRSYNKSDYLPCIAWGRNAKLVKDWHIGQSIKVQGRIQSRIYNKKLENDQTVQLTAYEISLVKIEKEDHFQHSAEGV